MVDIEPVGENWKNNLDLSNNKSTPIFVGCFLLLSSVLGDKIFYEG